jgi:hypothetical protein
LAAVRAQALRAALRIGCFLRPLDPVSVPVLHPNGAGGFARLHRTEDFGDDIGIGERALRRIVRVRPDGLEGVRKFV